MEDNKVSLLDLLRRLSDYYSILNDAIDIVESQIDARMANRIYRDLVDIGERTHVLLGGPQLKEQFEFAEQEVFKLSVSQRNDLYSLIFDRLKAILAQIDKEQKFENNLQTIETLAGLHKLSDPIDDFRTKIGNFYKYIFQQSFQPFMQGMTIENIEQKQKLEKLLGNIEQTEDVPTPANIQKLQWDGQKNQMYWVLKHLKGQGLITNSYEQLAVFLRQCVIGFENTAQITITTELSRGKPPTKSRRPDLSGLPPAEQEGKD